MSAAIFACFAAVVITWPGAALAQLDRITQREALSGLKAALERGAHTAVAALGRADGFLGNPQVKIPLPVKKMTAQDAKTVLTGGETAGTEYFRRSTHKELHGRFLPIVKNATAKAGVAQRYKEFAKPAAAFGLLGEEEKKIRKDPVGASKAIIRKVFGAL